MGGGGGAGNIVQEGRLSPLFSWDFRDSYALNELPPYWFVTATAVWRGCLNFRGGLEWGERAGEAGTD